MAASYDVDAFVELGKVIADEVRAAKENGSDSAPVPTEIVDAVLRGALDVSEALPRRSVRMFVSSTFTDTEHVRNLLMEHAYPHLGRAASLLGWQFQSVDMRWGVRKSTDDDHGTWDLCMREVRRCVEQSAGPAFLAILADKYGYRPFPRRIEARLFERLRDTASAMGIPCDSLRTDVDGAWWRLDENAVPADYVLENKSSLLPDILNDADGAAQRAASEAWWAVFEQMRRALFAAARALSESGQLDAALAEQFHVSITHAETLEGIVRNPRRAENALLVRRSFATPVVPSDTRAGAYIDLGADGAPVEEASSLLAALKSQLLPSHLPPEKVRDAPAPAWTAGGLNPAGHPEHKAHVERMALDIMRGLGDALVAGYRSQRRSPSAVYDEALHHAVLRASKCRVFVGRQRLLDRIAEYVGGTSAFPLVVHGRSGSGKTALMAAAAERAAAIVPRAVHIVRFMGTSAGSTAPTDMLQSVCSQILRAYGGNDNAVPSDMKALQDFLPVALSQAREDAPLVLFLDSLDQLSGPGDDDFKWVPSALPLHVRMVVSVLPERGECYASLRDREGIPAEQYVEVAPLGNAEVPELIDVLLSRAKRTLTSAQREAVLSATDTWLPLYAKLVAEEVRLWPSTSPPRQLPGTVRGMIFGVFERLEQRHGLILVSRALAYLTASESGLSSSELDDILSLDDDVLNDVFEWWDPPMRRLPPSLWLRIASDAEEFLIERGVDGGTTVIAWYHSQFVEAARDRYLNPGGEGAVPSALSPEAANAAIAQYFLGTWAGVEKPFVDRRGRSGSADRRVADHRSWTLEGSVWAPRPTLNRRRTEQLVKHLIAAKQWESPELADALCDLGYVYAKVRSGSLTRLMHEYGRAIRQAPKKWQWRSKVEAFHRFVAKRSHAMAWSPHSLLQDALNEHDASPVHASAAALLASGEIAAGGAVPVLRCLNKEKEESLVRLVFEAQMDSMWAAHSPQAHVLITSGFYEPGLYLWDMRTGLEIARVAGEHGAIIMAMAISPDGNLLAYGAGGKLFIADVHTGKTVHQLKGHHALSIGLVRFSPDGRSLLSIDAPDTLFRSEDNMSLISAVVVWDVATGEALRVMRDYKTTLCKAAVSCDLRTIAYPPSRERAGGVEGHPVLLLDVDSCKLLATLSAHKTHSVGSVSFSPTNPARLLSECEEFVCVWDTTSPTAPLHVVAVAELNLGKLHRLHWSPHGRTVHVSHTPKGGERRQGVVPMDPDTGKLAGPAVHFPCRDVLTELLFDEEGELEFVLESLNQQLTKRVWDFRGAALQQAAARQAAETSEKSNPPLAKHKGRADIALVSRDGRYCATASYGQREHVLVWDVATGTPIRSIIHPRKEAAAEGSSVEPAAPAWVEFAYDNKRLVTASNDDRVVRVWDIETGKEALAPMTAQRQIRCVALSDKHVAVGDLGQSNGVPGRIAVWDINTGKFVNDITPGVDRGTTNVWVAGLGISKDGEKVACVTAQDWVQVYDIAAGSSASRVYDMLPLEGGENDRRAGLFWVTFSDDDRQVYVRGFTRGWFVETLDLAKGEWRRDNMAPAYFADHIGERCFDAALGVHLRVECEGSRLLVMAEPADGVGGDEADGKAQANGVGSSNVGVASLILPADIASVRISSGESGTALVCGDNEGAVHIYRIQLPNPDAARAWVAAGFERQRQEQMLWDGCCTRVSQFIDEREASAADVTWRTAWQRAREVWLTGTRKDEGSREQARNEWIVEAGRTSLRTDGAAVGVGAASVAQLARQTQTRLSRRAEFEALIGIPYENHLTRGTESSPEDSFERCGWEAAWELWKGPLLQLSGTRGNKSYGPMDSKKNWARKSRELQLWMSGRDSTPPHVTLARITSVGSRMAIYQKVVFGGIDAWLRTNAEREGVSLERQSPVPDRWRSPFDRRDGWAGAADAWRVDRKDRFKATDARDFIDSEQKFYVTKKHAGDEAVALLELRAMQCLLRKNFRLRDEEAVAMDNLFQEHVEPAVQAWLAAGLAASEGSARDAWSAARTKWEAKRGEWSAATSPGSRERWRKRLCAGPPPEGESLAVAVADALSEAQRFIRSECHVWDDEARREGDEFKAKVSAPIAEWLREGRAAAEKRHAPQWEACLEKWGDASWATAASAPALQLAQWSKWVKNEAHDASAFCDAIKDNLASTYKLPQSGKTA